MKIVGVSFNKPAKNAKWAEKEGFGYELWSDQDRVLAMHYGAARSKLAPTPARITVVLDARGDLALRYDDVEVGTHPADVLEDCRALFSGSGAPPPP